MRRRWTWLLAPVLVAICPVLSLYVENIHEVYAGDAALCGGVVIGAGIAIAYLFRYGLSCAIRASLATVVLLVWCFTYSAYMRTCGSAIATVWPSPLRNYVLILLWILLLLLALFLLLRHRWSDRSIGQIYQLVTLACVFSVAFAFLQGIWGHVRTSHNNTASDSIWANDLEVVPMDWEPRPVANARDVYYLVFDRYGNADTLKRYFGFDNSAFYDELEKRGFVVDRKGLANYPSTALAMCSVLNMRYLGWQYEKPIDYFATLQRQEVGRLFIEAGYEYHFFGNFYAPLRKNSLAHWNMKVSMLPSEFADSLVGMTPLASLIGHHYKRRFVIGKFAVVAKIASNPKATFGYAHFLVPHPPYVFARDGSAQSELHQATRTEQELYVDQVIATNRLILKTIDDIIGTSATKPIIILQADEGPYLMAGDESLSRGEQIAKRTAILNAVLIPDKEIEQRLPRPLMPVNTFRFLLKEYFGAPLELLPNRVFYWETPLPTGAPAAGTRIVEVTQDLPVVE